MPSQACYQCDDTSWLSQPYGDLDARWFDGQLFCSQSCEDAYREELKKGFRLRLHVSLGPWKQPWFFARFKNGGRWALGPVFVLWVRPIPGNPRFEFCLNVARIGLKLDFSVQ